MAKVLSPSARGGAPVGVDRVSIFFFTQVFLFKVSANAGNRVDKSRPGNNVSRALRLSPAMYLSPV